MAVSKPHKYGFTLVELSIVLVIIGLLIGGILIGQSLVSNVKVMRIIKFYEQHVMAFEGFREKFKCIPGDCNKGFSQNGNNSNFIGDDFVQSHVVREPDILWLQLHEGGFLQKPYTGNTGLGGADRLIAGVNVPIVTAADDLSKEAILVFYGHFSVGNIANPNWARFEIGLESDGFGSARLPAFKAITALSIDKKIDDGLPSTGYIVVDGASGGCSSSGLYNTDVTNGCALFFYHQVGSVDHLK